MNEQIVRVYTVKKRRKGKYKKRETKRRRKEEEERVDRARWKDSVRSVTNSGFLHATCLHDNIFDTLDSVVSRLEATFLSSVRFSFKLYVSYTALHCILSRGVPCKEGRGGEGVFKQSPSVEVTVNRLPRMSLDFSSFTEPRAIVLGMCTNRLCFIVYIRQCVSRPCLHELFLWLKASV